MYIDLYHYYNCNSGFTSLAKKLSKQEPFPYGRMPCGTCIHVLYSTCMCNFCNDFVFVPAIIVNIHLTLNPNKGCCGQKFRCEPSIEGYRMALFVKEDNAYFKLTVTGPPTHPCDTHTLVFYLRSKHQNNLMHGQRYM